MHVPPPARPARQEAMDVLGEAPIRLPSIQSKAKTYHLMVPISVNTLRMIVDCVSGRRPKCVAALHVLLGGSYFRDGWPGSFRVS